VPGGPIGGMQRTMSGKRLDLEFGLPEVWEAGPDWVVGVLADV
jgi:hypothetical protein